MKSPKVRIVKNLPPDIPNLTKSERRLLEVLRIDPNIDHAIASTKLTNGTIAAKLKEIRYKYRDYQNLEAMRLERGAPAIQLPGGMCNHR